MSALSMAGQTDAFSWAESQVAAVRDDPKARLELLARTYNGPTGHAPQHLPYKRAALSFMNWQAKRGLLNSLRSASPGSLWWREVNERLLRDGCEAVALVGGAGGIPSSQSVRFWLQFIDEPHACNWYRAHNASIIAAYLEHRVLAERENEAERFFMNVVLERVIYAHALSAKPDLALGRFAPLGIILGDPRLGMAGAFLSLGRVLPDEYPIADDVENYIAVEHRLGRVLDYAVILPRIQRLIEWSAVELREPRMLEMVYDGNLIYAWPYSKRYVWHCPRLPFLGRMLGTLLKAR